jgi:hypothetical protein
MRTLFIRLFHLARLYILLLFITGCGKVEPALLYPAGKPGVMIRFFHSVNHETVIYDSLLYKTGSGDSYRVEALQYFISGVALHIGGKWVTGSTDKGIHYVDARDAGTCEWKLAGDFPSGEGDSIRFTFGLDPTDNQSYRFADPPERDMFWPEVLGGGYHYLKMNLKWSATGTTNLLPFMFHLGIGQMYSGTTGNPDSIIGFIHNHFTIVLPVRILINENTASDIPLNMNLEKWFDGVFPFRFGDYPMGIMQNQEGMFRAGKNGENAFSILPSMK